MPCPRSALIGLHAFPTPVKLGKSRQIAANEKRAGWHFLADRIRFLAGQKEAAPKAHVKLGWSSSISSSNAGGSQMVLHSPNVAYSDDSRILWEDGEPVVVHPVPAVYQ